MVRAAKVDGTTVPRSRPHLNQIMVGLVLLAMGTLIVYMYRIIDDLHKEQQDLRGQLTAMAKDKWPHLLVHPGSEKFLDSKGEPQRFAKTVGSKEDRLRRPVEHRVEEVHPGHMAAFEVPIGAEEEKRRLAGFFTTGTAAGVGCFEVADSATTTYTVSSATACNSNACPDCFITPATVSQDMTITIAACSTAQWIRSTTRTGAWEYKFINTHATYTMSITDNSGSGITYKVPPQSHVTGWCTASLGTNDRLYFPSTTLPTLSVDSGLTLSAGAFDASASSGAFSTSSGTNTLNGNTVINGAGTFSTGTGNVGLNGNVLIADSMTFTVGSAGSGGAAAFYGTVAIGASGVAGQGRTLTLTGDLTQQDPTSSTAAFTTGSGAVGINGDVTIAANKHLTMTNTGTGAFTTGTGAITLNGATTITGSNTFTTGLGNVELKGATTVADSTAFTVGSAGAGGTTTLYGAVVVGDSTGAAAVTVNGNIAQADVGATQTTFTTGTGAVSLNGDVAVASGKNLHMASGGAGTFQTGTGTATIYGNLQISGSKTFTTGTGAVSLQGTTNVADGVAFSVGSNNNGGLAQFFGQVIIGSGTANGASTQLDLYGDFVGHDDLDGTAKTFATATGTSTFNGDVAIAFNKDLTMSNTGTGTFTTGTGAIALNGDVTIAAGKTLTVTDYTNAIQCNLASTAPGDTFCKASR
ncbi:unnamed protein product [Durusdinium trenchii]|uniref:Uncharacterized protein n=1 Tax=Durusdinium trenchii TaxID=1381693 RepID=A0ABP0JNG5_9DINO